MIAGRRRRETLLSVALCAVMLTGCGSRSFEDAMARLSLPMSSTTESVDSYGTADPTPGSMSGPARTVPTPTAADDPSATGSAISAAPEDAATTTPPPVGSFTMSFAGDVNFAERTATRLAENPATAFGVAAAGLAAADLTMVNLETAITTSDEPEPKQFTFEAPPAALTALRSAGVDLATMANNHAADYGSTGLADTLHAITDSGFPVVGVGADEAQAYAPFTTSVNGLSLAVFAATQVHDHTLAAFRAGPDSPGVAAADSPVLVDAVRAAAATTDVVVVYLHWGTEYESCPNGEQQQLADELAAAGATAVVGAHAHVLQGAGWRDDGVYVAYGLSNYLWWRSFGNEQDDNGVLALTFAPHRVTTADFTAAHLDDTGVPVPATGDTKDRIDAEWADVRDCAGLSSTPPP